jgi:hypothetical protein
MERSSGNNNGDLASRAPQRYLLKGLFERCGGTKFAFDFDQLIGILQGVHPWRRAGLELSTATARNG